MKIVKEENKIYVLNDKEEEVAYVLFPLKEDGIVLVTHTYVSEKLRGMKIAEQLMEKACEVIRSNNQKVIPLCTYAKHWFDKHPENHDILY